MINNTHPTIRAARRNMRLWSLRWREARAFRDRQGMAIAFKRALLWRETSHNHAFTV